MEVTNDTGLTYTSDAGYTGPDQFDYSCLISEGVFGTVFVQVHPAAATTGPSQSTPSIQPVQPTEAAPSAPVLASTGSDTSGVTLAGAALVLVGGLLLGGLALTRRPELAVSQVGVRPRRPQPVRPRAGGARTTTAASPDYRRRLRRLGRRRRHPPPSVRGGRFAS